MSRGLRYPLAGVALERGERAGSVGAFALAAGFALSIAGLALLGCGGEQREPEPRPAEPASGAATDEARATPPESEVEPAAPRDGVSLPDALVEALAAPPEDTAEVPRFAASDPADPIAGCAMGCTLLDAASRWVIVRPRFEGESGVPASVSVLRVEGREITRRELRVETPDPRALDAFYEGEREAPWLPSVRRALGTEPYRAAPDLVDARGVTVHSIRRYAPLVSLRAPLEQRWLFVELGESAYRFHLLRADRSVDRLLATLPLRAAACNTESRARACIMPIGIDGVFASADGRTLLVLATGVRAGHEASVPIELVLPLDDASVLPSAYDASVRRAELERSLTSAEPRASILMDRATSDALSNVDGPPLDERAVRCFFGCALFREDGQWWVIRPYRIEDAVPREPQVFVDGSPGMSLPRPSTPGAELAARVRALGESIEALPRREGRALTAHAAVANDDGFAYAPLVELRAPHAPSRVEVEVDGDEYVVSLRTAQASVELGRVPAIQRGGVTMRPGILEVYAPPTAGYPLVILGAARTTRPSEARPLEHQLFHLVVPALPSEAPR